MREGTKTKNFENWDSASSSSFDARELKISANVIILLAIPWIFLWTAKNFIFALEPVEEMYCKGPTAKSFYLFSGTVISRFPLIVTTNLV